ncbi:dependent RNA helicase [Seminavis robusta]|uniref:ATP-dependent RNA helicase n=1 Tax=Seminavis robusta TaxID=568900 RepID=A0A9N8EFW9_9STRA|nr:dependent RNA helicase [Seminavis robusta]|eukprot:Sro1020_g232070.1 dependent RNA helicase (501) ;mRNA; r:807-2683
MMEEPLIDEASALWNLEPFLVDNLKRDGFTKFFPIQSLVIPDVVTSERFSYTRAQDICVSAPTGSGKTLAFVLPILNVLSKRQVRRLRALVVLPSRDLGQQVYEVFQRYSRGSDIVIGLAIGNKNTQNKNKARQQQETDFLDAFQTTTTTHNNTHQTDVDVLVCTPGKLMDYLNYTPGFTLQHLRFLVVDEVDRLLSQPYQDWIGRVMDATKDDSQLIMQSRQLRKLLFSATLTKDPQKLSALRLVRPKYFDARKINKASNASKHKHSNNDNNTSFNKYSIPAQLEECTVECTAEQKPIVLLALLRERLDRSSTTRKQVVLVFTASVDATHRLARLLQLLWKSAGFGQPDAVAEFSSSLSQSERSHLMKRCESGNNSLQVIVCSDGMSRGISVDVIGTVVNYDVPNLAKTYIHRCGRTARAGKNGLAVSLLKGGQVAQFKRMRQTIADPLRVQSRGVQKKLVKSAVPVYMSCLKRLATVISAEQDGVLKPTASIPQDMFP